MAYGETGEDEDVQPYTEEDGLLRPKTSVSIPSTTWQLVKLAVPLFLSSVSWVGMKATDTSLLGHLEEEGTLYLSAVAVADLWTSSTGVFIQGRVLGTFVGQAVGAGKPDMAGVWLQVSLACLVPLTVIPLVLWSTLTSTVISLMTTDTSLLAPGALYAGVLASALPGRVLYSQLSQYLTARHVMYPTTLSAAAALLANLGLGLFFILGLPHIAGFPHQFGFSAAAPVTVSSEYVQLLALLLLGFVIGRHQRGAWPENGWTVSNLTRSRVGEFYKLYLPSALATGSDFWRVTVIGVIAARQGALEVAVFNVGYRFLWICLMFSGALARAAGIQIAIAIGNRSVAAAKSTAKIGLALVCLGLVILSAVVCFCPSSMAAIFSSDQPFVQRVVEASFPLAALVASMNLTVALEAIVSSLGKTRHLLVSGLVGSWLGQVPICFLFSTFWRNDIIGLFWGMAAGYGLHAACLALCLTTIIDWDQCAQEASSRNRS